MIFISSTIISLLIWLNFQYLNWVVVGVILFLIWWWMNSSLSGEILEKFLGVDGLISKALALFLSLFLLGFVLNIFTSWLILNNLTILLSLILVNLVFIFWKKVFSNLKRQSIIPLAEKNYFKVNFLYFYIFIFLIIVGFWFLLASQTGEYIVSPWQVLSPWYLVIFFILSFISFLLVFSNKDKNKILVLIILFSLLSHAYLLVYSEGFGGDRWRHLGSEYRIIQEMEYQPTLVTDDLWQKEILGVEIPQALISVRKLSYGFQWSLSAFFSKLSGVDVFNLDKYLLLMIWSLFFPIILANIAWQLWAKKEFLLLAGLSPILFYVLQYYGAQTLPISFGVMFFAFMIGMWLVYLKNKNKKILFLNIFLTFLMYFSYSLSFILGLIMLGLVLFSNRKNIFYYIVFALLSLVVFLLEYFSSYNHLQLNSLRQIFDSLIISNSWFYFGSGQFLLWPQSWFKYVYLVIMILFVFFVLYSLHQMMKKDNVLLGFVGSLFSILVINYLLSWIFLDGLHTLSRRLNVFVVILFVIIFSWGIINLFENKFNLPIGKWLKIKSWLILLVIVLSVVSTLTYVSGPILNASVSTSDVGAMRYIWQEIESAPNEYCVVANTWPLLVLEGFSSRRVIAGNFFQDYNHQQDDRVEIFNNLRNNFTQEYLNKSLDITDSSGCFLMLNFAETNEKNIEQIESVLGQAKTIGDNFIWQF